MKKQTKTLCWAIINAVVAGGLVFFGALSVGGEISSKTIAASGIAAAIVILTKLKAICENEETETKSKISQKIFSFIP